MIVQSLQWDSEFFGFSVGSLDVASTAVPDDIIQIVESCECDVVYVQVENPTLGQLERFSRLGPLVDHKIVYEKTISAEEDVLKEPMPPYQGGVTDALVEMAWASGRQSRFYLDPQFHPHYRRFYRTWLVNSIEGALADVTFVPCVDNSQVGFVSAVAQGTLGQIGLIVVDPVYRRLGIAGELLQNVQAWCQQAGLIGMRVVTQERNTAAGRLYEKHGYRIAKTVAVYHYWNSSSAGH
jgi:dTDP-4-amino-4,6-dideoxy-D-galactose acyltransferase